MEIFSAISDPVAIIHRTGDIRFANASLRDLLHMQPDAVASARMPAYLTPSSWDELNSNGFAALSESPSWRARLEFVTPHNRSQAYDACLFNYQGTGGDAGEYVLAINTRFEAAVPSVISQAPEISYRVRSTNRATPVVLQVDSSGHVTMADEVALQKYGVKTARIIGERFCDLPFWPNDDEFRGRCEANIDAALSGEVNQMLSMLHKPTGERFWMELSFSRLSRSGSAQSCVSIKAHDVTARIESEIRQQQYTRRLDHLSKKLLHAQEDESRRIAQNLHDEIGQSLTALRLGLHNTRGAVGQTAVAQRIDVSIEVVDQILQQVRGLCLDLRPAMLDELGLVAALDWFVKRQSELTNLDIRFDTDLAGQRWTKTLETCCFRVAQEAISNAMRHSGSERIDVTLSMDDAHLFLKVKDFGCGFNTIEALEAAAEGQSLGLFGMQQRAALAGGDISMESAVNGGTRISIRLPLSDD